MSLGKSVDQLFVTDCAGILQRLSLRPAPVENAAAVVGRVGAAAAVHEGLVQ